MKVLIFGATGTAGAGVLRACLAAPGVDEVRAIVRRPLAIANERLRVYVHTDFEDYAAVEDAFAEVDACLWCLGISVTQVSGEAEYRAITHDFAVAAARALRRNSPGAAFHFVSGQGTAMDSRMMWARVKGQTEQDLMRLVDATCWRPAYIDGELSAGSPWFLRMMQPVFRLLSPVSIAYVRAEDIGWAMIRATREDVRSRIIENPEIRRMAAQEKLEAARTVIQPWFDRTKTSGSRKTCREPA
jgi:uncharacterized protein YbjT (DUF2867 family)